LAVHDPEQLRERNRQIAMSSCVPRPQWRTVMCAANLPKRLQNHAGSSGRVGSGSGSVLVPLDGLDQIDDPTP
jgi:hypothetical protein